MFFISVTAHLHNSYAKLHLSTPVCDTALKHHCPLAQIWSSEHFTDQNGSQHVALRQSGGPISPSLSLKAIQTSAPHINNFPFLLHSLCPPSMPPSSFWVAPDPVPVRPTGRSVTRRSEVTAPRGRGSRVGGKRSGEGRPGSERVRAEAWGLDTSPRSSLSSHPSQTFKTLA